MSIATAAAPRSWTETDPADWPPYLLSVADLPRVTLDATLDLAAAMKRDALPWRHALAGQTLACFFDPPTTGMTVATGTAADWLGMLPLVLPRDELGLGQEETVEDMARALSTTASVLFAHTVSHRALRRIAAGATVPLVNGLSDQHRPCQAIADLLTLREPFGSLEGLVLAYVGDAHDGTVHSLLEAGAIAGMDVRVACPDDCRPSRLVELGARILARMHDGRVTVTDDVEGAVRGADAVYTHAWDVDGRDDELKRYQVGPNVMRLARSRAVFMHCLPAQRGKEVHRQIFDGRHSVVWQQAANRVPAEQAVLYSLATAALARGGG